uniref:(northern house mosquito) hypothetical protein n=1 Tax=Culex pipiens TaxID=7175 RepID=A0A8D8D0B1_CULPI
MTMTTTINLQFTNFDFDCTLTVSHSLIQLTPPGVHLITNGSSSNRNCTCFNRSIIFPEQSSPSATVLPVFSFSKGKPALDMPLFFCCRFHQFSPPGNHHREQLQTMTPPFFP